MSLESQRPAHIEVDAVTKMYGKFRAVNNVSFEVKTGEIVAFVGPNGAGKSTLLKTLSTYRLPSQGHVRISGYDTVTEALDVRKIIGYLPENSILYESMRVDRFLDFVGKARGLKGAYLSQRFDWVVDRFMLETVLHKRIHQCSKGFHRRVAMAMALIHDPKVILLDEPTHGLDPMQVVGFRDFLCEISPGRTILFSSHIFQEVAAICDRLLVIHGGTLLADGDAETIAAEAKISRSARCTISMTASVIDNALKGLKGAASVAISEELPGVCRVAFSDVVPGLQDEISDIAQAQGWPKVLVTVNPVELESLFALLIRRSEANREEAA